MDRVQQVCNQELNELDHMLVQLRGGGGTPLYGLYRYVRPKGYGFSAVLVINRVSIIAILPPLWS